MPRTPAVSATPSAARASAAAAPRLARQPGPPRSTTGGLAVAILLASATGASAQAHRDSPEWGGLDHQPTQSEVIQREKQAGVRAPKGQVDQNKRAVEQLDQQLLHEETANPPRSPVPPASR